RQKLPKQTKKIKPSDQQKNTPHQQSTWLYTNNIWIVLPIHLLSATAENDLINITRMFPGVKSGGPS
ncbi:hypothetical protein, partial [Propionibacterium sp.]|uniref:hypothetical protein n=1 Tax=Propionibacterium sp. TaxID=1977903 RepID=UPI0039ECFDE2